MYKVRIVEKMFGIVYASPIQDNLKPSFYCLRYDDSGTDLVATGSADSTVKVWDTATGTVRAKFQGGSSNAILSCDISNGVVVGGGSDKTCRVWNLRTQRMVRSYTPCMQLTTVYHSEVGADSLVVACVIYRSTI